METVTAEAPFTALRGQGTVEVTTGETTLNIILAITGETATVTPADGSRADTQEPVLPDYSSDIEFMMPDENGEVEAIALPGSFEPASVIVIVNDTNGAVLTLTAGNDGSINGKLPATLNDTLIVTVTTPEGTRTTWTTSRYAGEDGSVSIGPGGGVIEGEDGIELRVPTGALERAAILKIERFDGNLFSERPDFPEGHFGSGIKLTATPMANFKREADLVFPKPVEAPEGSFYYVYRRVEEPDGSVWFETIDHAFLEGEGDEARVVTASPPFPGVIGGVSDSYFLLLWSYDAATAGMAKQSVITGYVRRMVPPGPGEYDPTYKAISGAHVQMLDPNGNPRPLQAYSQSDGKFAFWDAAYGAKIRRIRVTTGSETMEATVYETTTPLWGDLATYYQNIGYVNVTFPAVEAMPEAPLLDLKVLRSNEDGSYGDEAGGIILVNTPLVFGMSTTGDISTPMVDITGPYAESPGVGWLRDDKRIQYLTEEYRPAVAGSYTVRATAIPVFGGAPVTVSKTPMAER